MNCPQCGPIQEAVNFVGLKGVNSANSFPKDELKENYPNYLCVCICKANILCKKVYQNYLLDV